MRNKILLIISSIFNPIFKIGFYIWLLPSWISLSILSKYKIVQSTIFWLLFIPTTVKITEKLPDIINVYGYPITISLPFSWYYLYFSAIFIFFAQLYFKIISPSIYKENISFEDFIKNGRNDKQLNNYISDFMNKKSNYNAKNEEELKNIFWQIWYEYKYEYKIHRFIITFLYFLGFFFLRFVIIENIIFVSELFLSVYEESSLKKFFKFFDFLF